MREGRHVSLEKDKKPRFAVGHSILKPVYQVGAYIIL